MDSFAPFRYTQSLDRAATLSQDYQSFQALLALGETKGWNKAFQLFHLGAYCQSVAELTLSTPLEEDIEIGTAISANGVLGITQEPAEVDDTTIQVRYVHSTSQEWSMVASSPSLCSSGGNPNPNLDNCFESTGQLEIVNDSTAAVTINYMDYNPKVNTVNAISLRSISLDLPEYVPTSPTLRDVLSSYEQYYGDLKYADQYVQAAFQRRTTTFFANGQQDFSDLVISEDGVSEAISLGSLTMNVWMHVLVTLDRAVKSCWDGDSEMALQLWDDAVGFYTGIGGDPSLSMLYQLGEEYCQWFGTCDSDLHVNARLSDLFSQGRDLLGDSQCTRVQNQILYDMMKQMTIPLIQGVLYHAYEVDVREMQTQDYVKAELATFAAALLPRIETCNSGNASLLWINTRLEPTTSSSFEVIKGALERQYDCLGITCQEVGGIVDWSVTGRTVYHRNAEPCHIRDDAVSESFPVFSSRSMANTIWISVSVILAIALVVCIPYYLLRRRGRKHNNKGKGCDDEPTENSTDQTLTNLDCIGVTEIQMKEIL